MKDNNIPVIERLERRIANLQRREDENHVPIGGGNPYWKCNECGVADPELSCRDEKHYGQCSMQGIGKEIDHYEKLLKDAVAIEAEIQKKYAHFLKYGDAK
jgi:hypothetical protein